MSLSISREDLLGPLQRVIGAVERRQTLPILGNVLLRASHDTLSITATDLEVELHDNISLDTGAELNTTIPARKLLDICKSLPEQCMLTLNQNGNKLTISAGRSRFSLSTLPTTEFPSLDSIGHGQTIELQQRSLKRSLVKTAFSMAQQDVRYYLNGLLLELDQHCLRTVSTDGHRLSCCIQESELGVDKLTQAIIPRKGVLEIARLLTDADDTVTVTLASNHIQLVIGSLRFTSKLIEGRFPDYQRVIPSMNSSNIATIDREVFKHALQRVAILSHDKFKGVRLTFVENTLKIQANNPEQEEAEEEIAIDYSGHEIEIGFNIAYLQDALSSLEESHVQFLLRDDNSSGLLTDIEQVDCKYVVMPMRL